MPCACSGPEVWLPVAVVRNGVVLPYEVSSAGGVRSLARKLGNGHWRTTRLVLPQRGTRGYYHVFLWHRRRRISVRLHRLVAFSHLPAPMYYEGQVNHRDGDKSHNCKGNLEWMHGAANIEDRNRRQGWKRTSSGALVPIGSGADSSCESSPSEEPSRREDGPTSSFSPSIRS